MGRKNSRGARPPKRPRAAALRDRTGELRYQGHIGSNIEEIAIPQGMCGRKIRYAGQGDADKALRRVRSEKRLGGIAEVAMEKRSYCCDRCGGWHLTKMLMSSYERGTGEPTDD